MLSRLYVVFSFMKFKDRVFKSSKNCFSKRRILFLVIFREYFCWGWIEVEGNTKKTKTKENT